MTSQTDEELLADLGVEVEKEIKPALSQKQERIIAGFEDIQRFVEENGRPPLHGEERDIFERLYAVRLDQIRSQEDCVELLRELDHQGLLDGTDVLENSWENDLDDEDILAELGVDIAPSGSDDITNLRNVKARAEVRGADDVASRKPCEDFELFKPLFLAVKDELKAGLRKTRPFQDDAAVSEGSLFVLSGQMVYVAFMGEIYETQYGRTDSQLRVIYDNGTESDIKMRSLQRALNKDKNGRRITDKGAGPLFTDQPGDEATFSGLVYVCRSNSNNPEIAANRDIIHKIGVTKNSIEQRMANVENDPTFLLASVEVVATFQLYSVDRNKVEKLLHKFFEDVRLNVEIRDRFNKPVEPREWFMVPFECIDETVSRIIDGSIVNYYYDASSAKLVQIER